MDKVISQEEAKRLHVSRYVFKPFEHKDSSDEDTVYEKKSARKEPEQVFEEYRPVNNVGSQEADTDYDEQQPVHHSGESPVEMLLTKVDELSTNLVKTQMQYEKAQSEFEARVDEEKRRSFDDGYEKAKDDLKANYDKEIEELNRLYVTTIEKLQKSIVDFEEKLAKLEADITHAALQISSEIIKSEVSQHSSKIAAALAEELLSKVRDATRITLKVSPENFAYIEQHIAEKHPKLKIEEDSAISKGGVIVLSDIGNLDGTIASRFEKIKKELE